MSEEHVGTTVDETTVLYGHREPRAKRLYFVPGDGLHGMYLTGGHSQKRGTGNRIVLKANPSVSSNLRDVLLESCAILVGSRKFTSALRKYKSNAYDNLTSTDRASDEQLYFEHVLNSIIGSSFVPVTFTDENGNPQASGFLPPLVLFRGIKGKPDYIMRKRMAASPLTSKTPWAAVTFDWWISFAFSVCLGVRDHLYLYNVVDWYASHSNESLSNVTLFNPDSEAFGVRSLGQYSVHTIGNGDTRLAVMFVGRVISDDTIAVGGKVVSVSVETEFGVNTGRLVVFVD